MGIHSELDMAIKDLRSAATTVLEVADRLTKLFSAAPSDEDASPSLAGSVLTMEQVRAVLSERSRKGHTDEVRALLRKYGSPKLSGISPSDYAALVTDVEGLDDAD